MITLPNLSPYTGDFVAPSPNHDARRASVIEGIVLHATADNGEEANALSWLRSPRSRVSCHLLVGRDGEVIRLVGDRERAWHAGVSRWRGTADVNSITLGVEIANRNDGEPYTDAQYRRVAEIVAHYCRQGLSPNDVVSHGEIAGGRRTDPLGWDWDRFRAIVRQHLQSSGERSSLVPAAPAPARRAESSAGEAEHSPSVGPLPGSKSATVAPRKPILRSRTVWLNGLTVLAAGAAIVGETMKLAFWVGITVPREITMWTLFSVGVVNIMLRFRTTQPIGRCDRDGLSSDESSSTVPGGVGGYARPGAAAGQLY